VFVLIVGFVLVNTGICSAMHLSMILTNMVTGMFIVNTQPHGMVVRIGDRLTNIMALLFVLFFTIAGAHLRLDALSTLGTLGVGYVIARSVGLMGGARLGAVVSGVEDKIRKYLGLGILSQAGVAIGLSLIIKQDFAGVGPAVGSSMTLGDEIGNLIIATITVTCIFFELVGPILTKIGLEKAGEIKASNS